MKLLKEVFKDELLVISNKPLKCFCVCKEQYKPRYN